NIGNAEIAKGGSLDEPGVLGVIAKQAKQNRESIDAFRQGNRSDLVAKEERELSILQEYLPQPMSSEEIAVAARQAIAEVGAVGPGDKGKVMGKLMPQVKGKADGGEVNAIVSELLANM
ncbi:MAG: GatB/YqeY domain-containing protein, partial [Dehalococcoidia bacterium]|nr:GatB/YqeY domain-containing protein [Dehalococcoidia bacterium]